MVSIVGSNEELAMMALSQRQPIRCPPFDIDGWLVDYH